MFDLILNPNFWLKIVTLFLSVCYMVFAAMILSQVRTMDKIVQLPPTKIILGIAVINILLGAFIFIVALVIL